MCDIIRDLLPENGIHIAYVYITTFHFWSSDAKLLFKSSKNFTHFFPDFFPFKMSPCHPALALQLSSIETTCFRKRKHPLKEKGKRMGKNTHLRPTHRQRATQNAAPGSDFLGAYWACLASLTQGGQWTVTRTESPGW